jgi:cytochrome c oxidase assembly factor CtaG
MTRPLHLLIAALPPLTGRAVLHTYLPSAPLALLAVVTVAYLAGVVRQNRLHPRHPWPGLRTGAFLGAVLVTAVALFSFIGLYDATLFWVHMVQHLLLIMVAASLFAASSPIALLWRATSGEAHRRVGAVLRSQPALLAGHPVTAFVLYGVLVPITHLTVFFNWAVEHRAVDEVEHVLFLSIGYLFWRQIVGADPNRYRAQPPIRALLLFLAVPVDTFVGVTLNAENHEIFPALAELHRTWGPSLVADLRLGGVIMWVGGDTLMMIALIPVAMAWVRREERSAQRFDHELVTYFPAPEAHAGQPTAGFALGTYRPRRAHRSPPTADRPGPPSEPDAPGVRRPGVPGSVDLGPPPSRTG